MTQSKKDSQSKKTSTKKKATEKPQVEPEQVSLPLGDADVKETEKSNTDENKDDSDYIVKEIVKTEKEIHLDKLIKESWIHNMTREEYAEKVKQIFVLLEEQ